jgi:hypothetical protein
MVIEAVYMSATVYRQMHSRQNRNLVGGQSRLLRLRSKYHLSSKFKGNDKDEFSKDPDTSSFNTGGL